MTKSIRCKKCKKVIAYLPDDYVMNVKVECAKCYSGVQTKTKTKETLVQKFSRMKKGPRADVFNFQNKNYSFKSRTEANFARILNHLGIEWTYEEDDFFFSREKYKTKPYGYLMDFTIVKGNSRFRSKFYEVKGYMTTNSKQRLRRLRHNYPEEADKTTVVIYSKYNKKDIEFCNKLNYNYMFYDELAKEFKDVISHWE